MFEQCLHTCAFTHSLIGLAVANDQGWFDDIIGSDLQEIGLWPSSLHLMAARRPDQCIHLWLHAWSEEYHRLALVCVRVNFEQCLSNVHTCVITSFTHRSRHMRSIT